MNKLEIYEEISSIADLIPDMHRERFAALILELADAQSTRGQRLAAQDGSRRWARDAGYLTPGERAAADVPTVTWHRDPEHPGASGTYVDNRSRLWLARSTGEKTWFIHRLTVDGKVGRVIGRAGTLADAKTLGRARILAEIASTR